MHVVRQLESKEEMLGTISREVDSLREQFKKKEQAIEFREKQITDLKQQQNEIKNVCGARVDELVKNLAVLSTSVTEKTQECEAANKKLSSTESSIGQLEAQLKSQTTSLELQGIELTKSEHQRKELEDDLKVLAKALEQERHKGRRNVFRVEKLVEELRKQ
jgi:chromosome segregation ATPase